MRKNIVSRIIGGFVIGVVLGQLIQFIISVNVSPGSYMAVVPEFRALFESEITAVFMQVMLTGLIGTTFATSALIFEIEKWSMLKQYLIHFCITSLVWLPTVMLLWMPKEVKNFVIFIISFIGTYLITWMIQYRESKRSIEKINLAIQKQRREE